MKHHLNSERNYIPLEEAMLCINCDVLFSYKDFRNCPRCGSKIVRPLTKWFLTISKERIQLQKQV